MFPFKCDSFDCENFASLFIYAFFDDAMSTLSSFFTEVIPVKEEGSADFLII